jgi:acetyltransferase-like isoleucine patch superfamily enzyme
MKIVPIFLRRALYEFKQKYRYPNCIIHYGATADPNSHLGEWSVLFSNSRLVNSSLGKFSYVQENTSLYGTEVGPFCSIAANVTIGLIDHPTFMVSTSPVFYDNTQPLPRFFVNENKVATSPPRTVIEADVWIGEGVRIKAGVKIGVGAVIGAGSLVTKDVPPYVITAGVPSRILRHRFDNDLINRLLKSEWWKLDENYLNKIVNLFSDPVLFLNEIEKNDN